MPPRLASLRRLDAGSYLRTVALALALGCSCLSTTRAQVRIAPISHGAGGGEEDFAFQTVEGPLSALERDDGACRTSAWLESGIPHEIEERFVFRGGPAVPVGTFLLNYRLTALLYRDGGSDLGLGVPVPPPLPSAPGYLDASEERYLLRMGFEALIGNQPIPAMHDFPSFPGGAVVNLFDALPRGYPVDARWKWDTGSSAIPAEWPEALPWSQRWDPLGSSPHPGLMIAHGPATTELVQNTPRGREVAFQFVVRALLTAGNFDVAHRWDALSLELDFQDGRGFQPWGRLEEYLPQERLDPRTGNVSRFRATVVPTVPITDGRTIDDRCLAVAFNDSQPVLLSQPLELWDEFEYDLLPYGLVDGRSLDALSFDATLYLHGAQGEGPNRALPFDSIVDDAELELLELARVELYDWIQQSWTPLGPSYLGGGEISPSAPLRWRSQGPGSAADRWSRPTGNGNDYPGGIHLRSFAPAGFAFQPGHIAPNGRVRLRVFTQYRETTDWQRLYDATFAWDSAQLSANFGRGCAPQAANFPPTLLGLDIPQRGAPFSLRADDLPAGGFALLALGSSNTQWLGAPLPIALSTGGSANCELLVAFETQLGALLAPTQRSVQWDFPPIPRDPLLTRAPIWAQVLVIDGGGQLGVSHGLGFRVR
ncbi:MAG: hypothetical protein JNM84_10330 [Planctomycetes bacterium]|nr:hypothetical protein [Planctomycetota bacterium]